MYPNEAIVARINRFSEALRKREEGGQKKENHITTCKKRSTPVNGYLLNEVTGR